MLDPYMMTICGDKAAIHGLRTSAVYNWAKAHSVDWNDIVCADDDDLFIAVLNGIRLQDAHKMLADAEIKLGDSNRHRSGGK